MSESDSVTALAAGLFRRLRDVILVAERIEDFAFGADDPSKKRRVVQDGDTPALARELVLRGLRVASEATNWRMLEAVSGEDQGSEFSALMKLTDLPRLAVTERANELIQAGLCVRAIDADRLVVTEAGMALVEFVSSVSADLAQRTEQAAGKERTNGGRGLPVL